MSYFSVNENEII